MTPMQKLLNRTGVGFQGIVSSIAISRIQTNKQSKAIKEVSFAEGIGDSIGEHINRIKRLRASRELMLFLLEYH
jgi:hypothetical protein